MKIDVKKYFPLSYAEEQLLEAVNRNGACIASRSIPPAILASGNATLSSLWSKERIIRAELLSEYLKCNLTRNGSEVGLPTNGVSIYGAKIDGTLRLQGAALNHRFLFTGCAFSNLNFQHSRCRALNFQNCAIGVFDAMGAHFEGDLIINNSQSMSRFSLFGAEINGTLSIQSSKFLDKKNNALLSNLKIRGLLIIENSHFYSKLELDSIHVGGNVSFAGTSLFSKPGSLSLQNSILDARLYFSRQFCAHGEVVLLGTKIAESILCSKATFLSTGKSFGADRCLVGGTIFIKDKTSFFGEVRLIHAKINSQIEISDSFIHEKGALLLENAVITGNLIINNLVSRGSINCSKIKTSSDVLMLNLIVTSVGTAIQIGGAEIGGSLVIAGCTLTGTSAVDISYSKVGSFLNFRGSHLYQHNRGTQIRKFESALNAIHISAPGSMHIEDGFFSTGLVNLANSKIDGDLIVDDGETRPNGAQKRNTYIGKLQLRGTRIASAFLALEKARLDAIDFRAAHVGSLIDCQASWPRKGRLLLDRFSYDTLSGSSPRRASQRIEWLERQKEDHLRGNFRPQPFEQVALVLRRMGQLKDSQKILIKKSDLQNHQSLSSRKRLYVISSALSWLFLGRLLGYGYRPFRVLIPMLILIFVGEYKFNDAYEMGYILPTKARAYLGQSYARCTHPPAPYPTFNPLMYSVDTLIPFLDLHQEENWLPRDYRPAHSPPCPDQNDNKTTPSHPEIPATLEYDPEYKYYLWFHIAMGWVLTTLAVAGFSGLIKKE